MLRAHRGLSARPATAKPQQQRPHAHLPGRPAGHGPRDLQQRTVHRRPVHAPRVLRSVGTDRTGLSEDLRQGQVLERASTTPEPLDEEGLRSRLQGVRLPVRPWPSEEGPGLDAAAAHEPHLWAHRGDRRRQEEETQQEQEPEADAGRLRQSLSRDDWRGAADAWQGWKSVVEHRVIVAAGFRQRDQHLACSCSFQEEVQDRDRR